MTLPAPSPTTTALITGASSGIGAEIARNLAGRGHGVVLVARSAGKLEALAAELKATGVRAEVLAADLTDRDARAALPGRVAELGLAVSILVNNAGLSTTGPVLTADVDAELTMVEVDVAAVVDLTTRFLPTLVEHKGALLNVASSAAFQPLPGQAGYGAAKAFVASYSQAIAEEVRRKGVTVTALCPGPVATEFFEAAGFSDEEKTGMMPGFMWEDVVDVAAAAVDGLDRGRLLVIPGLGTRAAVGLGKFAPRRVLLAALGRQHPALRR
ncbi:SDR family NAD(P)-dependent oxidoreductase [Nocardioides humilatus]|uniref:SDR family NAD(P)-dependent oxidoreductase n=1 Tax=Nocardioides humilatus TaxID=2607660 RepID=A0A5B1LI38_9ACTN|nr:SDR family NAD(P)-dependent oxidoreductase [Nocardioides humilatus]KAA1419237.1 SDR family NAD(P)-dependent oxidoreductase [Nocardioides humilatus]